LLCSGELIFSGSVVLTSAAQHATQRWLLLLLTGLSPRLGRCERRSRLSVLAIGHGLTARLDRDVTLISFHFL